MPTDNPFCGSGESERERARARGTGKSKLPSSRAARPPSGCGKQGRKAHSDDGEAHFGGVRQRWAETGTVVGCSSQLRTVLLAPEVHRVVYGLRQASTARGGALSRPVSSWDLVCHWQLLATHPFQYGEWQRPRLACGALQLGFGVRYTASAGRGFASACHASPCLALSKVVCWDAPGCVLQKLFSSMRFFSSGQLSSCIAGVTSTAIFDC